MIELNKNLNQMINATVIASDAGGGAGSIIKLEVNSNDNLLILWIECAWRIEKNNTIISTSADDITPVSGLIATTVKMLENKVIKNIELNSFYDLVITFTDEFILRIFCIYSHSNLDTSNWELWLPDENLSFEITNDFKIKTGKYYSND